MEISEIRVKLVDGQADRLKAYCTMTLGDVFVIRDLKIVDGTKGLFVAMPSRRLTVSCPKCGSKNHLRAKFCNECGGRVPATETSTEQDGRSRLHKDIAHPITPEFRQLVQQRVIEAYEREAELSKDPDYKPESEVVREQLLSEYDSLIADLKAGETEKKQPSRGDRGSKASRPQRDRQRTANADRDTPRETSEGEDKTRRRRRRGGRGRGRRDEGTSQEGQTANEIASSVRDEKRDAPTDVPAEDRIIQPIKTEERRTVEDKRDDAPVEPVVAAKPQATERDEPQKPEKPEKATSNAGYDDDDMGFGVGIL